ncbi:diguanylate cyclase domain-containing protein [Pantoea sp. FN060301]|uniref:diguanylate cyclase domain-containing protein n=1 Tax=Pantoea sp. FN060301 TaxID=3420380 RepID=UPI003D16D8A4
MPHDQITLPPKKPLLTLKKSLQRIHLVIILVSLLFSGISLSVLSLLALRSYAENNLELVATTIGYSVQPALLAGDNVAAARILKEISREVDFGRVRISDASHHVLLSWPAVEEERTEGPGEAIAQWIFPAPVKVAVMLADRERGEVWLTGDASRVLIWLSQVLKWLGGSLLVTALLAFYLSHRMHAGILAGLHNIASVAQDVRRRRAFSLRVPASSITELNKLNADFHSLLDEFSLWQRHLQSENASLSHQAYHDELTGLPNRAAFVTELHRQQGNLLTASQLAVFFIDGDRFKEVNDRYGHAAGDTVLAATAQRLRSRLRKGDLVARLGGDEFAVLLSAIDSGEQAARVAEAIVEVMRAPIRLDDGTLVTQSLSIGIALGKDHRSAESIMAQADAAMYHIKERGGGWFLSPLIWKSETEINRQRAKRVSPEADSADNRG